MLYKFVVFSFPIVSLNTGNWCNHEKIRGSQFLKVAI